MYKVPSETKIKSYIKRIVFGKHLFCPECFSFDVAVNDGRYRCGKCRKKFSLLSHTWLANTKLSLSHVWLLLWCWTQQVPVKQSGKFSELSEKGVRHWFDVFRKHLPEDKVILEHIVQLDEAYFGRFGRVALFMGKQIGTRKLAYQILRNHAPSKLDAFEFIKSNLKPNLKQLNLT